MKRLHLVEIEDLPWCPAVVRDGATAFLRTSAKVIGAADAFAPLLDELLRDTGSTEIVDLCSGGAGPLPEILALLQERGVEVRARLTDRYPNRHAMEAVSTAAPGRITPCLEPVDATDVPDTFDGVRTIFNAFHHFPPELARAILADAVAKRRPIAVFEIVGRSSLPWILLSPAAVQAAMPFVEPFRASWLALSWIVPVIPALVLWDGTVSCLRVYDPDDLRELISGVPGHETFDWRIEQPKLPRAVGSRATVLLGRPRRAD